jgi:hypothetical protein
MSPDAPPELEPAVGFDSARLIADVRKGDVNAIREACRIKFGDSLGRLILLHALSDIGGVGMPRGPEPPELANHNNGRAAAMLKLAELAGFDPTAIAAAGLTQVLEGASHEREYGHQRPDRPDVGYDDDDFTGAGGGGGGYDHGGFHGGADDFAD